ncbi:MAG TPA: hypothetical protein EYP17_01850 [Candidatus Latescibacteria bacterium]|nr:hypothetical protein [Candidatus Latescibacterota bacterium]
MLRSIVLHSFSELEVEDGNRAYETSNLIDGTFTALKLNLSQGSSSARDSTSPIRGTFIMGRFLFSRTW